jgi:hypothetical protein
MTSTEITVLVAGLILVPAGLYGLHRLALYLEAKDLLYYQKKQPQSGWLSASLTPVREMLEPQTRHVVTVEDERHDTDEAGDGESKK